ncbi:MAG: hypothetical protein GY744_20040 [Gammaproteobacteria bacterium]|nr:hypothetical protein [Gammaproteobacteria bacterium]
MIKRLTAGIIYILFFFTSTISSAQSISHTGKVVEVIHVKSYTYLRLENPPKWIATSPTAISENTSIEFVDGVEMGKFYSKVLNRTFESIIFVPKISLMGQHKKPPSHSAMKNEAHGTGNSVISKSVPVMPPAPGEIVPLSGGKTITDIIKTSAKLKSTTVKLRAKVMKFSKNILGKNWVTLQDGTGTSPDNKLRVTSSEVVSPGDLVEVSGTLMTDIDLGSGYTYKVILEKAKFTLERKGNSQ